MKKELGLAARKSGVLFSSIFFCLRHGQISIQFIFEKTRRKRKPHHGQISIPSAVYFEKDGRSKTEAKATTTKKLIRAKVH